ncbi:transposase [Bradyrhizobium vignae]|uniref:Transposase n=1 Tax=Bradyrhizobium vignae TaxID=1549949 RepID=A0ABS4A0E1_9BRAD|nr:transposase [Bradyrhizobium vignae]
MQVNVLDAERRRRWSYDEKVRLVEETLQPGETVCGGGTPARGGS